MSTIILRQYSGNTEPRLDNISVKDSPLSDPELDNNFNTLNNIAISALESSNNKLSVLGGNVSGNVNVIGSVTANTINGNLDCGIF